MEELWNQVEEWSLQAFGPADTCPPDQLLSEMQQMLKHMRLLPPDPERLKRRLASLLIVVMDAAARAGVTFGDIQKQIGVNLEEAKATWSAAEKRGGFRKYREQAVEGEGQAHCVECDFEAHGDLPTLDKLVEEHTAKTQHPVSVSRWSIPQDFTREEREILRKINVPERSKLR